VPQSSSAVEWVPPMDDLHWMHQALRQAREAGERGEVPVGAIVVEQGQVLGAAANAIEQLRDPTAHAEMIAIRRAVEKTQEKRLLNATIYVTLEPCAMCAGAIVLARVPRLVFAAYDPKGGACGTLRNVVQDARLNHRCEVVGGVMESECADLLKGFFARLRSAKAK